MPTVRQSFIAGLTRLYPFYSGCGTFANLPFMQAVVGTTAESVWARVPGGEVLASLNDYVGRAAFYVGDLDRKISWICRQIVRPGDTVIDVGANIGIVTVWLSHLVGPQGKVYAFEPNPYLQSRLESAVQRNKLSNVRLHPVALGGEYGELELRVPLANKGGGSFVYHKNATPCDVIRVPVAPLSAIIEHEKVKTIRLMKVDVEGFESEVLRGADEVLANVRPEAILLELNPAGAGNGAAITMLRAYEYELFSIPHCLIRMRLKRIDKDSPGHLRGHDLLAVRKGKCLRDIAKSVRVEQ